MSGHSTERIEHYVTELIAEGETALATAQVPSHPRVHFSQPMLEIPAWSKWTARCRHLAALLGELAEPWRDALNVKKRSARNAQALLSTLIAIEETVSAGLLVPLDDLVRADAFADLLEQADHLYKEGYYVAAGVLGRAVLEDHLRHWCDRVGCSPAKPRPTLGDYNMELYKAKHLDKLAMKNADLLIAIGNDAAHNNPDLKPEDVERLLRDVREFITRHRPGE